MDLVAVVFWGILGVTTVGYLGYVLAPTEEDGNDLAEGEQRVPEQFRQGSDPESSVSPESATVNRVEAWGGNEGAPTGGSAGDGGTGHGDG